MTDEALLPIVTCPACGEGFEFNPRDVVDRGADDWATKSRRYFEQGRIYERRQTPQLNADELARVTGNLDGLRRMCRQLAKVFRERSQDGELSLTTETAESLQTCADELDALVQP